MPGLALTLDTPRGSLGASHTRTPEDAEALPFASLISGRDLVATPASGRVAGGRGRRGAGRAARTARARPRCRT